MFEKNDDGLKMIYSFFDNVISNNKLSHAYLIDANGNSAAMDVALSFAKKIIIEDIEEEMKDSILKRIDDGNYLDIKVIESDGIWIKKDELIDLQREFSKKAIEGKRKVYIIKEAEKMNVQTSNSLLKFLEEPVDDIIAILITNNINLILPTILSRCQILKLGKNGYSDSSISNFFYLFLDSKCGKITDAEVKNLIDNVINFAIFIEENGLDVIVYSKKLWHSVFNDRQLCMIAMELLFNYYFDALKYKCDIDNLFYKDRIDDIIRVSSFNDIGKLSKKVEIIVDAINGIKYNLNINLLMDKLVIDMCGDI